MFREIVAIRVGTSVAASEPAAIRNAPAIPFIPNQLAYVITCVDPRTEPAEELLPFGGRAPHQNRPHASGDYPATSQSNPKDGGAQEPPGEIPDVEVADGAWYLALLNYVRNAIKYLGDSKTRDICLRGA